MSPTLPETGSFPVPLPTPIGPFEIRALLGEGGMGYVYRAFDPRLQREVALKVMKPGWASDPRAHALFLREARALAALDHPHLITIHQVGEVDGMPFFVMPLLPGQTLEKRLESQPPLPPEEILRIGREIATALACTHAAGLIHRDLKPLNVFLKEPAGHVVVLDFGLARPSVASAANAGQTETMGTPCYMSPEQINGEELDGRSDLFSLGTLLYRVATGRLPFVGANQTAVMLAVIQSNPPPAHRVNPLVPPGLSELIQALLAKDRQERPASADEVVARLQSLAGGAPPSRIGRSAARCHDDFCWPAWALPFWAAWPVCSPGGVPVKVLPVRSRSRWIST